MTQSLTDKVLDKLIWIGFFALFIVPFLSPGSYPPVSKIYSEGFSLIIALAIGMLAIFKTKDVSISHGGIAAILFALFLLLQVLVIPIRIPGINFVVAIEMMVGAVLSIGVTSLINGNEAAQKKLITQIAWAAMVGAVWQAAYGFMQYTGQAQNFSSLILNGGPNAINVIGNIGQKNDYVDFITVGAFALAYLYFIRQVNLSSFIVLEVFLGFILTVSTSRIPFLFFIIALITAGVFVLVNRKDGKNKDKNKELILILLALFFGFFILEFAVPKLAAVFSSGSGSGVTSGLYRFQEDSIGQSTYRRFYEWYKDIIIFIQHPILV